jgi:hypothetical protein
VRFRVRGADIEPGQRDSFERAGTETVRTLIFLAVVNRAHLPDPILSKISDDPELRKAALEWLLEKADRSERLQTWNLIMTIAVTVFALVAGGGGPPACHIGTEAGNR